MHYYQFNIGDYRRDTGHLTLLEHGIYRNLLDTYYLNEKPLCEDNAELMRTHCIRTDEEKNALKNVLSDFFKRTKKGYIHKKCDEQIKKYNEKSEKARLSAKARWDAKAMRTHSEGNANHKPITNNHKPIKDNGEFDLAWSMYGLKGNKKTSKLRFNKLSDKQKKLMAEHIPRYVKATPNKQFRKNFEVYINQECWNDEIQEYSNEKTTTNIRSYETPTDRSRRAAEKLRRQQSTYTENSPPVQTNDRFIR